LVGLVALIRLLLGHDRAAGNRMVLLFGSLASSAAGAGAGLAAVVQIGASEGRQSGQRLAIAGLLLSAFNVLFVRTGERLAAP
jgi:hypothetical protein